MTASNEYIKNEHELHDAVKTMGAFFGVGNLEVEIKPGEGWACIQTKRGIKIRIDPQQLARDKQNVTDENLENQKIREVHALHTAGHEIGHARDMIEGGVPRATSKKDHFFWNAVNDTAIDTHLRRVPLLDSVTDGLYQDILFPVDSLADRPRHIQFMEAVLLKTVSPDGTWQFDPLIDQLVDGLQNYRLGSSNVNVLEAMSHHETSLKNRVTIAHQILKPIYDALFEEDVEDGNAQSGDGDEQSDESDENNESGKGNKTSRKNEKNQQDDKNQDKSDGDKNDGQDSDEFGDEGDSSDQFSDHYDDYEKAMHGGTHHDDEGDDEGDGQGQQGQSSSPTKDQRDFIKALAQMHGMQVPPELDDEDGSEGYEGDDFDADQNSDTETQLAGNIQSEMKLDKQDSLKYAEVLMKYRGVISDMADVLLKLSSLADAVNSPKYKTIADEKGRRIHPARMVQAALQIETGRQQSIWQPMETANNSSEFVFGGLDMTFVVDVSSSMSGDKGNNAGAIAIIMLEAIELAVRRTETEQRHNKPPDVRSRVIAFGSDTVELSPMHAETKPVEKGRIFRNLIHPRAQSTLVEGSLKKVQETAAANPGRDNIVFIITDGQFGDLAKAKNTAQSMTQNVLLTQLEINNYSNYNANANAVTPYNQVVKKPEDLPGAVLRVIWEYVDSFDQY